MIEEVTKAVRRNKTVDDKYIDTLYEDMTALYRLDRTSNPSSSDRTDHESLPPTAVALIATLGITWALIIAYVVVDTVKKQIKSKK
jgi:multiple sugar transport system substrate-binding protein